MSADWLDELPLTAGSDLGYPSSRMREYAGVGDRLPALVASLRS